MSCLRCGNCCDPIIMNGYNIDRIRGIAFSTYNIPDKDRNDAFFLLNDCVKLDKEEMFQTKHHLKTEAQDIEFFACWYFNDITRLCEHPNKPNICSTFPYHFPYNYKNCFYKICGYHRSLKNIKSVKFL